MRNTLILIIPLALATVAYADPIVLAPAAAPSAHITIDEHGVGVVAYSAGGSTAITGALLNDTGPGGGSNVLTYNLSGSFEFVSGDVQINDANGTISDYVEFNASNSTIVFYSNPLDGFDSLADTPGPPRNLYVNGVILTELGTGGNSLVNYTPGAGDPGYVAGVAGPVTYTLISDGHTPMIPEPSTLALLGTGLLAAVRIVHKRLKP